MLIEKIIQEIEDAKQENDYAKAKDIALDGLRSHTDDYRLYEELADIYLFEWNIDAAKDVLTIARELHPESGTGMYLDGYIATARGEFDRAIEILAIANKNLPNNPEILRNLGWAHVMKGEVMKWLSLLRRAHTLSPGEPMIINDLAVALMAAWEEEEARMTLARLGQGDLVDMIKSTPL